MSGRSRLEVAIVGQGFMGRAHALAWARARQMAASALEPHLAVLCGRDEGALSRNASLLGFERTATDWREVVASDGVDVVDVCTPGSSHAEIALAALAAGKHVLCEKPLANTVDEARRLAAAAGAAAARGVVSMVGFNYRRVPALAKARHLVAEGRLGELRHLRASYLQDWLVDPEVPRTWRLDVAEAGSGALGDLGAHAVDLVRWLSGEEWTEVVAQLSTFVARRRLPGGGSGEVSVDDAVAAIARLSGGGAVTLEATRMATGRRNALGIELYGTRGGLRFELERLNELELYEHPGNGFTRLLVTEGDDPYVGQWWPPGHVLGWDHSFVHEVEDLMAAIAEGHPAEPSFADGLAVQEVLDAIGRSASSRSWVQVAR